MLASYGTGTTSTVLAPYRPNGTVRRTSSYQKWDRFQKFSMILKNSSHLSTFWNVSKKFSIHYDPNSRHSRFIIFSYLKKMYTKDWERKKKIPLCHILWRNYRWDFFRNNGTLNDQQKSHRFPISNSLLFQLLCCFNSVNNNSSIIVVSFKSINMIIAFVWVKIFNI